MPDTAHLWKQARADEMQFETKFALAGYQPGLDKLHVHDRGFAVRDVERTKATP